MALFKLTRWPSILIFLLAGGMAAVFAFFTSNLFSRAMANVFFLKKFGLMAVKHGALIQAGELLVWGAMAMTCWFTFKICEHIIVERYSAWSSKRKLDNPKSK